MRDPIMQFFTWAHLKSDEMKAVSEPFCSLAMHIEQTVPRNPERTVALRKLLEAKDAAVRAILFKDESSEVQKLVALSTEVQSVAAGPEVTATMSPERAEALRDLRKYPSDKKDCVEIDGWCLAHDQHHGLGIVGAAIENLRALKASAIAKYADNIAQAKTAAYEEAAKKFMGDDAAKTKTELAKSADRVFLENAQKTPFVLNLGQIGSIAHEANRALTRIVQDVPVQRAWEDEVEEMRESVVKGVLHHMNNPGSSPETSHESWMKERRANGWVWGPVKDSEKKTHPALVPYAELPVGTRLKDKLFTAIVKSLMNG
jgi:RyR domain